MSKTYYIASRLENAAQVKELKSFLDAAGWHHTYDWTMHGPIRHEGPDRMREVAEAELEGVRKSQVVIVLLAGGRGTHTELGYALGYSHAYITKAYLYRVAASRARFRARPGNLRILSCARRR